MATNERYINEKYEGIDVNDLSSATEWIDVQSCDEIMIYIDSATGNSEAFEVGVEISPDGVFNAGCYKELVTGVDNELKEQGVGYMHLYNSVPIEYIRISCVTIEGSPSTVNIYVQGFRKL